MKSFGWVDSADGQVALCTVAPVISVGIGVDDDT